MLSKEGDRTQTILETLRTEVKKYSPKFTTNNLKKIEIGRKKEEITSIYIIPAANFEVKSNNYHIGLLLNYTPENYNKIEREDIYKLSQDLSFTKHIIPIWLHNFTEKDEEFGRRLSNLSRLHTYASVYEDFDEDEAFYNNMKLCTLFANKIISKIKETDKIFITSPELWMLPRCLNKNLTVMCFYRPLPPPDIFLSLKNSNEIIRSWLSCSSFEFQSFRDQNYFREIISRYTELKVSHEYLSTHMYLNPVGISRTALAEKNKSSVNINEIFDGIKGKILINMVSTNHLDTSKDAMYAFKTIENRKFTLINCLVLGTESYAQQETDNFSRALNFFTLGENNIKNLIITSKALLLELYKKASAMMSLYHEKSILEFKKITGKPVITSSLSRIPTIPIHYPDLYMVNPKDNVETGRLMEHVMSIQKTYKSNQLIPDLDVYYRQTKTVSDMVVSLKKKLYQDSIPPDFDMEKLFGDILKYKLCVKIYCDYDGTLTEIVEDPDKAVPTKELLKLLDLLDQVCDLRIVSGRPTKFFIEHFGKKKYEIFTEHGAEHITNGEVESLINNKDWINEALVVAEFFKERTPGLVIEKKRAGLTIHYRQCSPIMSHQINELQKTLSKYLKHKNVLVKKGNKIIEVVPKSINKGSCIKQESGVVLFIGDDTTDEDMFQKALGDRKYSIVVGEKISNAKFKMKNVDAVLTFLLKLYKTIKGIKEEEYKKIEENLGLKKSFKK